MFILWVHDLIHDRGGTVPIYKGEDKSSHSSLMSQGFAVKESCHKELSSQGERSMVPGQKHVSLGLGETWVQIPPPPLGSCVTLVCHSLIY